MPDVTLPLPADLPENWTMGQTVAPAGPDAGLSEQHGYNYLNQQVNAAQKGVNLLEQTKQAKLTGTAGQVVGFDRGGEAAAQAVPGHKHGAGDITSGVLPLARGGTGATTAAAARTALGAAAGYRYTCTIPTSGWANNSGGGKYQDITVSGMTAAMTPTVGIVQTNDVAASELMVAQFSATVRRIETMAGKIRVYTYSGGSTPGANIPIQLTGTV